MRRLLSGSDGTRLIVVERVFVVHSHPQRILAHDRADVSCGRILQPSGHVKRLDDWVVISSPIERPGGGGVLVAHVG